MQPRTAVRRAPSLVLLVLLGCTSVAPREPAGPGHGELVIPRELQDSIGFDAGAPDHAWKPGDRALYAVRLRKGELLREWIVGFRVSGEPPPDGASFEIAFTSEGVRTVEGSRLHPVQATVAEGAEGRTSSSGAQAPASFLERGFTDYCRAILEWRERGAHGPALTDEERKAATRLVCTTAGSLSALLKIMQSVDCLEDILWSVMEKPSLLSMVANLGVKLDVVLGSDVVELETDTLPAALRGRPVYRLPITIQLNERPALDCFLTVTTPGPPLELVAGVVRVEGWRTTDPSRRVELELLGARLADDD